LGFDSRIPQPTSGVWFGNSMTNLCWPRFLNSTRWSSASIPQRVSG
jgi:hypothetical protein